MEIVTTLMAEDGLGRRIARALTRTVCGLVPDGAQGYPVTVVTYHSISDVPGPYTVAPDSFRRQIEFIHQRYEVIRLLHVPDVLKQRSGSVRRVVLTFDDGYHDFIEHAFPALRDFQLPSTVFVPSAYLGGENVWDVETGTSVSKPLMNARQMRWLQGTGLVEFGSHTEHHVRMTAVSQATAHKEAARSKQELEAVLGQPVRCFAYPYGQLDDLSPSTTAILRDVGYAVGVTTHWGTRQFGRNLLKLRRVWFRTEDGPADLRAKIEGNDDWIAMKERLGFALRRAGEGLRALR